MAKIIKETFERMMKKTVAEFINYDVVDDCIDPETGKPLINKEDSIIERYYAYRNSKLDYDADVSLEANVLYKELFPFVDWFGKKVIRPQTSYNKEFLKYELRGPECEGEISFRGDTMNSVATVNRFFYKEYKVDNDFVWPAEALEFIKIYHNPGNFMILPFKIDCSPNSARGISASRDFFDLFLLAIYNFFLEASGQQVCSKVTLEWVFDKNKEVENFMRNYLEAYIEHAKNGVLDGWDSFVRLNILENFVTDDGNGHYGKPKELWTGHFESVERGCDNSPQKKSDYYEFWKNATEWIKARSLRIYLKFNNCGGMSMNNDWEIKLQEEFSFMKQTGREGDDIYQRWGFECSGGWYEIIRDCCLEIIEAYKSAGKEIDFVPSQIKEKWGTLRFYYGYQDAPCTIAAIDFLNVGVSLRNEPSSEDEEKRKFRSEISKIVRRAEERSRTTCEICGAVGELRTDLGGRVLTMCDSCHDERIRKIKERRNCWHN